MGFGIPLTGVNLVELLEGLASGERLSHTKLDDIVSASHHTPVPSGHIGEWHGLLADIPSGWVLCDGNNSTPDLLGRFVESVPDAVTDPGATGGSTAKTTSGHQHTGPIAAGPIIGDVLFATDAWGYEANAVGEKHSASILTESGSASRNYAKTKTKTDSISDIRPLRYDVAFIMKT